MRRFSIKYQMLMIAMIPVFLIDVFLTYVHVNSSINQAEQLLQSKGEIIARQIAGASEFNLFSGDYEHIQYLLNQTINTNDIVFTAVYDNQGIMVAEVIGEEYSADESPQYLYYRHAIQTQNLESSDVFSTQEESSQQSFRSLGWVHLYISRQRLEQHKVEIYQEGLIFFFATLALAILLTISINQRITRPIYTLLDHLKNIEAGNLGQVIKQVQNNEIGDVQKGFNSMSQSLLANRMQLDQKIKTATLDLMNAITDLEYKNREISQARDEAQNANKIKSQFLANISHEIRTPINGIKGFANLLSQTSLDSQQSRYTEIINQSTSDLSSIVNEVLDFSKIESNKVEIIVGEFDLHELVESTRDGLFTAALDKDIDLFLTIYSDTPRILIGDKLRLKQILVNLIGNAIKFTDHGFVDITVHMEDQSDQQVMLKFKIQDSGIGISKENQKLLFQAFKQIESDSNRRFSGTGLGLVISKNLAHLMGGDIYIDSVTDYGSLFTLVLPFKPGEAIDNSIDFDNEHNCLILAFEKHALNEIQSLYNRADCNTECILIEKDSEIERIQTQIQQNISYLDFIVMDIRHAFLKPELIFTPKIVSKSRIILMHYDLHLTELNEQSPFEFISVINTCKNLKRLLIEAEFNKQLDQPTKALQNNKTPHSVLIVDDNPINLTLATELAQIWGHHPFEANNAEQAMQLFRIKNFDLILLDIQMPEIDGIKLMQMMRQEKPDMDTPIAALTANTLKSEKNRLLKLGFDAYLGKPIDEIKLKTLLDRGEIPEDFSHHEPVNTNPDQSIDYDLTLRLSAKNQELMHETLSMLSSEIPRYQRQLKQAIEQKSLAESEKIMHILQGVASQVGLPRLKLILTEYQKTKNYSPEEVIRLNQQAIEELDRIYSNLIEIQPEIASNV